MLISPAYAQAAAGPAGGGMLIQLLPLILIFVVFYFLLIRPQQKKMKQHREMLANIRRGDRIVTGGGIVGRVARVEGDNELVVEIAPEIKVRVRRSTVSEVISRGEPATASDEKKSGSANKANKKKGARKRSEEPASENETDG